MISEQFEPNSFCEICENKEIVSYTLKDPYPSWQHFVLDDNNNGECDLSDLSHTQTTDNSRPAPDELVINYAPHICWPADSNTPTSLSEVHTDKPLWYVTNLYNHSGHVYGYQTRIINYSHS